MNLNDGTLFKQISGSSSGNRISVMGPETHLKPKEATLMREIQHRQPLQQQYTVAEPLQYSSRFNGLQKMTGSPDGRSRSFTKKNMLASPQARRPNIHLKESSSANNRPNQFANEATNLYMASVDHVERSLNSNCSSQPSSIKQSQDSLTITRNSSAASSLSNSRLCSNGDNKKARYCLRKNRELAICPKCAISLIEQNVAIEELESAELYEMERSKEMDDALLGLDVLSDKLKKTIATIANQKASIHKVFQEHEERIRDLYSRLRRIAEEGQQLDLKKLAQMKKMAAALIDERLSQLQPAVACQDQLQRDVSNLTTQYRILTDNDYLIKKQSMYKLFKKLEIYIRDGAQGLLLPLPRLRDLPFFQASCVTFLDNNHFNSASTEFSFQDRCNHNSNPLHSSDKILTD